MFNLRFQQRATSPFRQSKYAYDDMAKITTGILERFARIENAKCSLMRRDLMELDSQGSGLVPLKYFYSSDRATHHSFAFHESVEYLDAIGALDRSSSSEHP